MADKGGQEMKVEMPPQQGMGVGMTRLGDRDPAGCGHKETGRPLPTGPPGSTTWRPEASYLSKATSGGPAVEAPVDSPLDGSPTLHGTSPHPVPPGLGLGLAKTWREEQGDGMERQPRPTPHSRAPSRALQN